MLVTTLSILRVVIVLFSSQRKRCVHFFLKNQPEALIIQIYFVIKLYMFRHFLFPLSGVFHCTFGISKFRAGL